MMEKIRNLTAHQNAHSGLLDLFKLMARKTLERIDPLEKEKRARKPKTPEPATVGAGPLPPKEPSQVVAPAPGKSRRPDAQTLRALYARDRSECQFRDPETGRKCGSPRSLQVEHKIPFAKGGPTELENLELLCRGHNLLRAIEVYGERKMKKYLGG